MNSCSENRKIYFRNTTCYKLETLLSLMTFFQFQTVKTINRKLLFTFLAKVFDDTSGLSWPVTLENANFTEIANKCFDDLKPMITDERYKKWLNDDNISSFLDRLVSFKSRRFYSFGVLFSTPEQIQKRSSANYKNKYIIPALLEGKTRFAWVYNTDQTNKGSHWVAVFLNLTKKTCTYFDSFGNEPREWMKTDITNILQHFKSIPFLENRIDTIHLKWHKKKHQEGSVECGIYVLWYILTMLDGASFKQIENTSIKDAICREYRPKFFINKQTVTFLSRKELEKNIKVNGGVYPTTPTPDMSNVEII